MRGSEPPAQNDIRVEPPQALHHAVVEMKRHLRPLRTKMPPREQFRSERHRADLPLPVFFPFRHQKHGELFALPCNCLEQRHSIRREDIGNDYELHLNRSTSHPQACNRARMGSRR